jgi:hypothetical protein
MTSNLETRLRRYGETFERFVDTYPDDVVSRSRAQRSRPESLAAQLAAQVPAFSTADEVARRRVTRRAPVVVAIAAGLAVAVIVGGLLLLSAGSDPSSVETPAGPTQETVPRWVITPVPHHGEDHAVPVAVSCPDATHCVAVRNLGGGPLGFETLTDGTWSVTPSPNHGTLENSLIGVSCPDANHCVAVGSWTHQTRTRTLIETLSDGTWSVTPSPDHGARVHLVQGVSCADATHCVAVGSTNPILVKGGAGPRARTLIETLSGGTWSVTPSPNRGTFDNVLQGASCPDAMHCIAAGGYRTTGKGGGGQTLIETTFPAPARRRS